MRKRPFLLTARLLAVFVGAVPQVPFGCSQERWNVKPGTDLNDVA
jgi:hypothetical protein